MKRTAVVGWLSLGTLGLAFSAYGAMALGGTEHAGTLYAAEHLTAQVAGVLGVLLALLLVAASSGAERVLRGVALGLAAVALAAPAIYVAAQDVSPAVSDTIGCGRVTSPHLPGTALERSSCGDALERQRAFAGVLMVVPAVVAIASVVLLGRGPRAGDQQVPLP